MNVTSQGYPKCVTFNPCDLCLAVGTSDRVLKYWELSDFSMISSVITENDYPRRILFD